MTEWKLDSLQRAGLHLMGRATYQEMAAVWPSAGGPYAPVMNEIPKVVFSKTLPRAEWADSRIARGDLAAEIADLKRAPGGDLVAHGGAAFAQSLSRLGLVDGRSRVGAGASDGRPAAADAQPRPGYVDGYEAHADERRRSHDRPRGIRTSRVDAGA